GYAKAPTGTSTDAPKSKAARTLRYHRRRNWDSCVSVSTARDRRTRVQPPLHQSIAKQIEGTFVMFPRGISWRLAAAKSPARSGRPDLQPIPRGGCYDAPPGRFVTS